MNKKLLLVFIMLSQMLAGAIVHAQTTAIFDFGSQWKYLDNGSNQGTAWRDLSFADASWNTGSGFFGYGDSWITTCVNACGTVSCNPSCGSKYITTYFRKIINIQDTATLDSVRLSIARDDGMVVYINGVEVWRDNMPAGTITYTSTAPSAQGGADEYTPIVKSIPISAFASGNNIIAVELHQQSGTSSDLTFNMEALGVIRTRLFNFGAPWKYLDNGSNQGTAWRAASFNDASWAIGSGYMGYGETWTNTCVNACGVVACMPSCGTKYLTTYFRKNISILDVALFDSVRLSMYRDDGAVVYVNGVEVWRDHMPTGTIAYNTLASSPAIGGIDETTAIIKSIPISAFVNGSNTIAVEIHQQAANSSDLDFNMEALAISHVPPVPVVLTQGPYLQMGNQTAVSVRWRTGVASKSRLMVGTAYGTYPTVVDDAAVTTEHEVRVTGLTPDTKYYYRFGTDTSVLQGDNANFFVTAPADTSNRRVTIAVFGDCGRNDNSFQTGSLNAYQNYLASKGMDAADIMQLVGDNAYNSGTEAEFSSGFFAPYSSTVLKNHMLFPLPGNHDYQNGSSARQVDHNMPYYDLFTMPTAGECGGVASGTEAYYSYDWGANVHVLSLDSYGKENAGTTRLYDTLGAQVAWIKADLAANTKKWVIVLFHHPPYTMGSHNSDGEGELVNIRQNFIRILERYGVDLIICGHSHDYERSYLMKGHYGNEASFNKAAHAADSSSGKYDGSDNSCPYTVSSGQVNHGSVYVVSGSAGADGGVQAGYPHNAMPFSIDDGGMFFLDIKDNRLDAKFIRRNSTIGDQFTIMKDVKKSDTTTLLYGESVNLAATWPGSYYWAPGLTTNNVTVTPTADTLIEVKDAETATCLVDAHYIQMQCTMPDITVSPSDITQDGCHTVATYSISDTGRPGPAISYAFAGTTIASGNGTGSGSTFNIGVTNVTITATNLCGSTSRSFDVTIQPLPVVHNVTGSAGYCPGAAGVTVGLDNSQIGVDYQLYDGATAVGSTVAGTGAAIDFGIQTASVYTVLATDAVTGCTQAMAGDATIFIHSLPLMHTVTGGGNYCLGGPGVVVGLDNSEPGVSYQLYDGAAAVGAIIAGTGGPITFGTFTTVSSYSAVATNSTTGCISDMSGSVTVGINPLPAVSAVTGGGHYCSGGTGVAVGVDMSVADVNYQLYHGSIPYGGPMAGTGMPLNFGNLMAAGSYTVIAVDAITGCTSDMTGSANIVIDPLPMMFAVTGTGNYCAGGTGLPVGLAGSESGFEYQLYLGTSADGTAVTGTGTAISFGLRAVAGNYMVTARNTTTSCVNGMSGSAAIGINALPAVYSVTGGGNYCAGGTGVAVGLGGSSTGITYQLYNGVSTVGAAVAGAGLPVNFGLKTAAGSYSVRATNPSTSCTSNMSGSVDVSITALVTPAVTLDALPGTVVCNGDTVVYNASGTNGGLAPTYNWLVNGVVVSSGSSAYSYSPADGDNVAVRFTSSYACVSSPLAMATKLMTVRPWVMPYASITASPDDTVCEGTAVVFSSLVVNGGTGPVFKWIKNSSIVGTTDTYSYTPADGDGVVLNLTSNAPCRLADNIYSNVIDMRVEERYIPVVSISVVPSVDIQKGEPVLFTAHVTNAGPAPVYQWAINGVNVPGATTQVLSASLFSDKDSVSCTVKGTGECGLGGFNSVKMHVITTGVEEFANTSKIRVVPNPNNGTFTIEGITGSLDNEVVNIVVTNVLGQVAYTGHTMAQGGTIDYRVNLSNNIADGMYLITVNTASGNKVFHIVLKR
jgi:hypothetical protein